MRYRFPLFAKIACWFVLNLAMLAAVGWFVLQQQLGFGFESLLAGQAGDRIRSMAEVLVQELNSEPRENWAAILTRYDAAYPVRFTLFREKTGQIAGQPVTLPAEVRERLFQGGPPLGEAGPRPNRQAPSGSPVLPFSSVPPVPPGRPGPPGAEGRMDGPPRGFEPGDRRDDPPEGRNPPPNRRPGITAFLRAGEPPFYWMVLRFPLPRSSGEGPGALVLISETLSAGGLIYDVKPLLWAGAVALGLSALFWLPLIRGITGQIGALGAATSQIAEGHFAVRVDERRRDELGTLGAAINSMTERLAGLVQGQRRFLSDVAHELCAPLSRLQMSLGILEQRAGPDTAEGLSDLREEVDQMATLVNELLAFSRAAIGVNQPNLRRVRLREVIELAVAREAVPGRIVQVSGSSALWVEVDPDLLQRAVGNLVRNALHYAGEAGPITVSVAQADGTAVVCVADQGPGVPETALAQLFDPFFRVDAARTRETGGVGLGLTIARNCVEACRGQIRVENRLPHGLAVTIGLPLVAEAKPEAAN